jgi:hypothetical protein
MGKSETKESDFREDDRGGDGAPPYRLLCEKHVDSRAYYGC